MFLKKDKHELEATLQPPLQKILSVKKSLKNKKNYQAATLAEIRLR
jgi:hypothetical protein